MTEFAVTFTKYIPNELDDGALYVSMEHATAVHLCACGCRTKVVTPLTPVDWFLRFDGTVTIHPSISNGQFPCGSHYFIKANRVEWALPQSAGYARANLHRDHTARQIAFGSANEHKSVWTRVRHVLRRNAKSGQ